MAVDNVDRVVREEVSTILLETVAELDSRDADRKRLSFEPDPARFAASHGMTLWGDDQHGQIAMARSVVDNQLTVMYSGAGLGKTFLLMLLTLWWMQRPNSLVLATSGTYQQLQAQYWEEIRAWGGRVYGHRFEPKRTFWELDMRRQAQMRSTDVQGYFTGFHNEHVLVLVDESHDMPEWMPRTLRTALLNNPNHRAVLAGNPSRRQGAYYALEEDPQWAALYLSQLEYLQFCRGGDLELEPRRIERGGPDGEDLWELGPSELGLPGRPTIRELERMDDAWPRAMPGMDLDPCESLRVVEELGEHDPWVSTYVYGRFPKPGAAISVLYTGAGIAAANRRFETRPETEPGALEVGLDVAGSGSDRAVVGDRSVAWVIKDGKRAWKILDIGPSEIAELPEGDIDAFLEYLAQALDRELHRLADAGHTIGLVRVDCDGPGAGVAHRMASLGWKVYEFHGGALPPLPHSVQYLDMRGWGYWNLSQMLPDLALEPDNRLRAELLATLPRYEPARVTAERVGEIGSLQKHKGKKRSMYGVVKKDIIASTVQRSPDDADALMMASIPVKRKKRLRKIVKRSW